MEVVRRRSDQTVTHKATNPEWGCQVTIGNW